MSIPSLSIIASPDDATADIVVHGVQKTSDGPVAPGMSPEQLKQLGATGARGQFVRSVVDGTVTGFVGLGADTSSSSLRAAAASAVRALGDVPQVALALPVASDSDASAVLEGAALGAYSFQGSKSRDPELFAREVQVAVGEAHCTDSVVRSARLISEAVHIARDLVNTPPNHLTPEIFADRVAEEAAGDSVSVTVLDDQQLRDEGFGGISGVGQGSSNPPRLVVVDYNPGPDAPKLALVGKGITFDTGGISLKPSKSMIGMKTDMAGAATVYAAVLAIARLGLPIRVSAYLCLAENVPSHTSIKPEDVLVMRGGKTVEVTNTDAEGRLVLADGIRYAIEQGADAVIDVATLTGAQVVALGNRYTGVMGNNDEVLEQFLKAADAADEPAWPMPIPDDYAEKLESPVADLQNARVGHPDGGMLLAGAFLREFVEDEGRETLWVHVDFAGPASNGGKAYDWNPSGATGVMVRTLVEFAAGYRAK